MAAPPEKPKKPAKPHAFTEPGSQGVGEGWVILPANHELAADARPSVSEGQLHIPARKPSDGPIRVCHEKLTHIKGTQLELRGRWKFSEVKGLSSIHDGARVYLKVVDSDRSPMVSPATQTHHWTMAIGRRTHRWSELKETIVLPEKTMAVRLCAEVAAKHGEAWFEGLSLRAVKQ